MQNQCILVANEDDERVFNHKKHQRHEKRYLFPADNADDADFSPLR